MLSPLLLLLLLLLLSQLVIVGVSVCLSPLLSCVCLFFCPLSSSCVCNVLNCAVYRVPPSGDPCMEKVSVLLSFFLKIFNTKRPDALSHTQNRQKNSFSSSALLHAFNRSSPPPLLINYLPG